MIPVHLFRNEGGSVAGRFMLGAQAPDRFPPVHQRHREVHHDHRRPLTVRRVQRFLAVVRGHDAEAGEPEVVAVHFARIAGVVDEQDQGAGVLDGARDGVRGPEGLGGTVQSEKPVDIAGVDGAKVVGREVVVKARKNWVRVRLVVVELRLYQVMVSGPADGTGETAGRWAGSSATASSDSSTRPRAI